MKILFLTCASAHHYYLINALHKRFAVAKVFLLETYMPRKSWKDKAQILLSWKRLRLSLEERLMNALFYLERRQEERYEQDVLFGGQKPFLNPAICVEKAPSFNHEAAVHKVADEKADIIVVFGTPILKGAILNTAQKAMLNIHRGIVPQYKGGGITTWMLYNKDFDYSGVTIHMCTAALDAGDIVAQASYRIQKDDRIYTLRAKTTMLAAKLLKETINGFVQEKVTYTKQGQGRMWRSKDLDLGKEIMARRNLHQYLQAL